MNFLPTLTNGANRDGFVAPLNEIVNIASLYLMLSTRDILMDYIVVHVSAKFGFDYTSKTPGKDLNWDR